MQRKQVLIGAISVFVVSMQDKDAFSNRLLGSGGFKRTLHVCGLDLAAEQCKRRLPRLLQQK